MIPRGAAVLLTAALSLGAEAWAAPAPQLTLRADAPGQPGQEQLIVATLSWQGRPERAAVTPRIELEGELALRTGETRSSFDGDQTSWSQQLHVVLPSEPGPWSLVPLRATVLWAGSDEPITVEATVEVPAAGGGAGPAIGGALLLLALGGIGVTVWQRLGEDEARSPDAQLEPLLATARRAAEAGRAAELLQSLLELRALLARLEDPAAEPSPDAALTERLDRVRFAGEEVSRDECMDLLRAVEAAAQMWTRRGA